MVESRLTITQYLKLLSLFLSLWIELKDEREINSVANEGGEGVVMVYIQVLSSSFQCGVL